jgi:hypothetical protein
MPNTALEPTAAAPSFGGWQQIHACGFPRRGSAWIVRRHSRVWIIQSLLLGREEFAHPFL